MKDIKCPLCGNPLKLSTIENKGQLHFFACYKCNYQLRMSPHKDFALEYAKAFVSLFPPIMRVKAGDHVKVACEDELYAVLFTDGDRGTLYLQNCRGIGYSFDVSEIRKWPWELKQKGGAEQ